MPKGMEERAAEERDPVAEPTSNPEGMAEMAADERDPTDGSTPNPAPPPLAAEPVRPVKMLSCGRGGCLDRDRGGGSPARRALTTPKLPARALNGKDRERTSPPPKEAGTERPPWDRDDAGDAEATEAMAPEGTEPEAPE